METRFLEERNSCLLLSPFDNWNYNFLGLILIGQAYKSSPQIGISLFFMAPLEHSKHISFYIGNICCICLVNIFYFLFVDREVNVLIRPIGYCDTVITFSFSDWLLTNICWSLIEIFFYKNISEIWRKLCIMSGIIHQYTLLEITITILLRGTDLILMMLNIIIINNHHLISVNKIHKIHYCNIINNRPATLMYISIFHKIKDEKEQNHIRSRSPQQH